MKQSDDVLFGCNGRRKTRRVRIAAASLLYASLCGCGNPNGVNVFGAYFPLWLVAAIVGVVAAFGCRYLFVRLKIEPYVGPLVLIYVCVTVSVACLTWLLLV